MVVLLLLPTMSVAFKLSACIDLPNSTLQAQTQKMTESLSCHEKKSFNDFPSGMRYPLWKELSKGQGQMAQFVNKTANQSKRIAANKLLSFCSVVATVFTLKDTKDSGQEHVPPINPKKPISSSPTRPFFLSQIRTQSPAQRPFWLWKVLLDTICICGSAAEKRIGSLLKKKVQQIFPKFPLSFFSSPLLNIKEDWIFKGIYKQGSLNSSLSSKKPLRINANIIFLFPF